MHKVVFQEHREECFGSNVGNQPVHVVCIGLVKGDRPAVNVLLYQHFVTRLGKGLRKPDVFVNLYGVKSIDVLFLLQKIELFC
jgi:hypothetical protein